MLDFDAYADGIADAGVVLHANAVRAGLDAPVPTCPGWTVRDLLAHQGMVHRWATEIVRGTDARAIDTGALERDGLAAVDVVDWVDDGIEALLRTLDRADPYGKVWFFLHDAPPGPIGWARRQCHETTVHAVDALAAALGRAPDPDEVWFGAELAADGIDELLTGFLPRPKTRLRLEEPLRVHVVPDDADAAWTLELGPEGARCTRDRRDQPDTSVTGTAVGVYLGLWNRGRHLRETGRPLLDLWSDVQRITWS